MDVHGVRGWGSAIAEGVLALAGTPYRFVDVTGFDKPGQARDRLLVLNPLGQVPTVVLDDGTVLTESAAITLYLAERAPGVAPPIGDPDRARFLRLLIWLVANLYPSFTYGDYPARLVTTAPDELRVSTDRYRERLYAWLETEAGAPFFLGARCSALDVYVAVMSEWRPGLAWLAAHAPKLAAIAARTRALPALREVMAVNRTGQD